VFLVFLELHCFLSFCCSNGSANTKLAFRYLSAIPSLPSNLSPYPISCRLCFLICPCFALFD
jgi:hypothetical protein